MPEIDKERRQGLRSHWRGIGSDLRSLFREAWNAERLYCQYDSEREKSSHKNDKMSSHFWS